MQETKRTRTLDQRRNSVDCYYITQDGVIHPYSHQPGGWEGETSTMYDLVHPSAHKRMRRGEIILGECHLVRNKRTWQDAGFTIGPHPTWGSNQVKGDIASFVETFGGDPLESFASIASSMQSNVLTKAMAKVNSSTIMSGELLSDLDKTVSMLRHPFRDATQLLGKMLKYRAKHLGKTAHSAAKASSNAWLEYRYGWKPLLLDADSCISAAHKWRDEQQEKRLVARAGDSYQRTTDKAFSATGGVPRVDSINGTVSSWKSYRASAGVIYVRKERTTSEQLSATLGLRPRDVPATLWEIIPYSFVVDWFVNVGDWIQAITPNPEVNILGNWVSGVFEWSRSYKGISWSCRIPEAPATTYTGTMGGSTLSGVEFTRTINQSVALTPAMKVGSLSLLHSVDALALSAQSILGNLKTLKH